MNLKPTFKLIVLTCIIALSGCGPANDAQRHYNQLQISDKKSIAEIQSQLPPDLPRQTEWSGDPEADRHLHYRFPDESELVIVCKPRVPGKLKGLVVRRVDIKSPPTGTVWRQNVIILEE